MEKWREFQRIFNLSPAIVEVDGKKYLEEYDVEIPRTYLSFLKYFGAGKLGEMFENKEPVVALIPARSFEVQEVAGNMEDLLYKISENPQQFWPNLSLSYERIT